MKLTFFCYVLLVFFAGTEKSERGANSKEFAFFLACSPLRLPLLHVAPFFYSFSPLTMERNDGRTMDETGCVIATTINEVSAVVRTWKMP